MHTLTSTSALTSLSFRSAPEGVNRDLVIEQNKQMLVDAQTAQLRLSGWDATNSPVEKISSESLARSSKMCGGCGYDQWSCNPILRTHAQTVTLLGKPSTRPRVLLPPRTWASGCSQERDRDSTRSETPQAAAARAATLRPRLGKLAGVATHVNQAMLVGLSLPCKAGCAWPSEQQHPRHK